jgi:histidinol-phosphate phosphatase family protein
VVQQSKRFAAALLDRDGTLVEDVPYNADPALVRPIAGAREALDRLRAAGLRLGVVSNQSGIGRGMLRPEDVANVNARVTELLGPFDVCKVCPHTDADGCDCRKPKPGLVFAAAGELGVPVEDCVLIGDIGSDVDAARAAGAAAVLVPTARTLPAEIAAAPVVARDLAEAVDWVLATAAPGPEHGRVLVVRSDSAGDVLLAGPAIRAVAAQAEHVTLLCGPRGRAAAELLPGVDAIVEWCVPWIDPQPPRVDPEEVDALVKQLDAAQYDEAIVLTSFHQSPLPMALLLRLAGVPRVSAISEDYPGSLLDVRHRIDERPGAELSEVERALSLAAAAGYRLPPGDEGRLALRGPLPEVSALVPAEAYVVVHPGASVPARACPPSRCRDIVNALASHGRRVVVTGSPDERELTAEVAGDAALDLGGRTTLAELASVYASAGCVVVANTGPAHLAAAVGTPVVSLFAPTVPYRRWRPYGVPAIRLGDPDAPCRDSRAARCPVPAHPCLSTVDALEVVAGVQELVR